MSNVKIFAAGLTAVAITGCAQLTEWSDAARPRVASVTAEAVMAECALPMETRMANHIAIVEALARKGSRAIVYMLDCDGNSETPG